MPPRTQRTRWLSYAIAFGPISLPRHDLRIVVAGTGRRTTALAAALEAGFGSYAQFYRVFREQTGRSPSALRTAAADADLSLAPDHR